MGPLGVPEMVVIFILALVLFGPKKLPELGKTIGKAMTEFRRASNDLKSTFDREMQSLEQENQALQRATKQAAKPATGSSKAPAAETAWNPLSQSEPVGASATSGAESNRTSSTAASTAEPASAPKVTPEKAAGTVARGSSAAAVLEPVVEPAGETAANLAEPEVSSAPEVASAGTNPSPDKPQDT